MTAKKTASPAKPASPSTDGRFKKRETGGPFIKFENEGDFLIGTLEKKRAEVKGKFGFKNVAVMKITENCELGGKEGRRVYEPGEVVQMDVPAGMSCLFDEDEGAEVKVIYTGKVDTGKGNPANTFDVYAAM